MTTTATRAPSTAETTVRLQLNPHPSADAVLDGAWWPRTTDAVAELPRLVAALAGDRGDISHLLVNAADWDPPHPHRLGEGRQAVRLAWFTSQPGGLVTAIVDFGRERFDLLVVPPDTNAAAAEAAMSTASDPDNRRQSPDLLADIRQGERSTAQS